MLDILKKIDPGEKDFVKNVLLLFSKFTIPVCVTRRNQEAKWQKVSTNHP